jgi:RluA family pseudouridine synthase
VTSSGEPAHEPLTILWHDPAALVIDKPRGLFTQAAPGVDSVQTRLREQLGDASAAAPAYVGMPHRLDRPVTGCLLVGLTQRATRILSQQFESRKVDKRYLGLVSGRPTPESGVWTDWMRKIPTEPQSECVAEAAPGAQHAVLEYRMLEQHGEACLMEFRPLTGRMHQIRLQSATRGFPLWGDRRYGSTIAFGRTPEHDRVEESVALHAARLQFRHPRTGLEVVATAPLPHEWYQWGPDWLRKARTT